MKILIAPNSFKECTDSVSIADLFLNHLRIQKKVALISKPISDGGDGFLNVCVKNFGLNKITYKIPLPYGRGLIDCEVGYNKNDREIFIESANSAGLRLIPNDKRHPLLLTSRGIGVLLQNIISDIKVKKVFVDKIVIGIGGTGTNDMGIGMLSELGLKLIDKNGLTIKPLPVNFNSVKKILWKKPNLPFQIEIITDVHNPLLGINGASNIYGKQKGLTTKEIKIADEGFASIIEIAKAERIIKNKDFISGAGGGLAAGFQLFLNAKIITSDRFIKHQLGINKREKYDAVITAEGSFDLQSYMNKGTGEIIRIFSNTKSEIFLVCGSIDINVLNKLPLNVVPIEVSKYFRNKNESIKNYKKGIELACREIERKIGS
ncbi:MAG: glycerate kinase [Ignavibacteriaceae bacterium]